MKQTRKNHIIKNIPNDIINEQLKMYDTKLNFLLADIDQVLVFKPQLLVVINYIQSVDQWLRSQ